MQALRSWGHQPRDLRAGLGEVTHMLKSLHRADVVERTVREGRSPFGVKHAKPTPCVGIRSSDLRLADVDADGVITGLQQAQHTAPISASEVEDAWIRKPRLS